MIKATDREKTAFTIPGLGHFEWVRLPFGLINSPATFCRMVNTLLGNLAELHTDDKTTSVAQAYVDDIIIASADIDTHIKHLQGILELIDDAQLTVNVSKCILLQEELKFLGHIVSKDGISTDPEKTEKVASWPAPKNATEMLQFLGFVNYYRKFIEDFAKISQPLRELSTTKADYQWTDAAQVSFDILKEKFTSPPILAYPDMTKPFIIFTDASTKGLGYSLHQDQDDGTTRAIAFAGRALTATEKLYEITELECLGLVEGVRYFHEYVYGVPITVYTDHQALATMMTKKETPNKKLRAGMLALQAYDIAIRHKSGKLMVHVDALSRHPTYGEPEQGLADRVFSVRTTDSAWHTEQRLDPWCSEIITQLKDNTPDKKVRHDYDMERGLLVQVKADGSHRLAVPNNLRKPVLIENHDHALAGHLGQQKTYEKLSKLFYWPTMYQDAMTHIRECVTCQMFKSPPTLLYKPNFSRTTADITQAMQVINVDVKGPITPATSRGNQYILVITDMATRWVEAFPMPNQQANTVAQVFLTEFVCRHGCPREITSDRGSNFVSELIKEMNKELEITHRLSTPYSPWVNGCVERSIGTIMQILSCYVQVHPEDWDILLPYALYAYRTSQHSVTQSSPFYLLHGRVAFGPTEASLQEWQPVVSQTPFDGDQLRAHLADAFASLHINAPEDSTTTTTTESTPASLPQPGQHVWVKTHLRDATRSPALQSHWKGVYLVVSTTPHTLHLRDIHSGAEATEHLSNVKLYQGQPPKRSDEGITQEERDAHPDVTFDQTPLSRHYYIVEKIISQRQWQGKDMYLVKWEGYHEGFNTWEYENGFYNAHGAKSIALINWEMRKSLWGPNA